MDYKRKETKLQTIFLNVRPKIHNRNVFHDNISHVH